MLALKPKVENVPDIQVEVVPDFMKLPPNVVPDGRRHRRRQELQGA